MLIGTQHNIDINLTFGELGPLVEWASQNCTNNWNYEIIDSAGRDAGLYRFHFEEEIDFVKFTLWKK